MGDATFTAEEIARAKAAMQKPVPLQALAAIASGRAIVSLWPTGRDVWLEEFDGQRVRDPEHPDRKMGFAGAWALFPAGMIDRFGVVTPAGVATLASAQESSHGR